MNRHIESKDSPNTEFTSRESTRHLTARRNYRNIGIAFLMVGILLLNSACFESKVVTSKVNPPDNVGNAKEINGVFYALPRTVVKVDIPVVRTDKAPGRFYAFTPCFFPDEDYVKLATTGFKIASDKVKLDTLPIPDTSEVYMIKTKGGMFETRNLELDLTESGVLVKANADVTNDTIDIVTGSIKAGVGILAKASGAGLFSSPPSTPAGLIELDERMQRCREIVTKEWDEVINDESDTIQKTRLLAAKPKFLANVAAFRSDYIEAEMIAKEIANLQKRRSSDVLDTTTPPAAVSPETLRLVLDELDKAIKSLKDANFAGSKSDLTWNSTFKLNPDVVSKMSVNMFTFSQAYGVCSVLVKQGQQLDPRFQVKKICPPDKPKCKDADLQAVSCTGQTIRLELKLGENGEGGDGGAQFSDVVKDLKQNGDRGFYYRIPGRAIAYIEAQETGKPDTEVARAPLSIAQFGKVVSLPASTGGRKTKYTLALYESSGAMKNFVMGSDSLVKQKNIDDLTAASTTAIDAKGERNKAKQPADELQQLERQRKILEEKKKIRALQDELDEDSSDTN